MAGSLIEIWVIQSGGRRCHFTDTITGKAAVRKERGASDVYVFRNDARATPDRRIAARAEGLLRQVDKPRQRSRAVAGEGVGSVCWRLWRGRGCCKWVLHE